MYWGLILLTVVVCFVSGVKWGVVLLVLVLQKLAWAFNLAVALGCVKLPGDTENGAPRPSIRSYGDTADSSRL